jgi:hypothetical protein
MERTMVLVKLLHDGAKVPEMGRLYACESTPGDRVRTGVSVTVPPGMRGVVQSPLLVYPCLIDSGEEIVLSIRDKVSKGEYVGSLLFSPTEVVVEGDGSEMGPIA